jgi:hypothetical protein
MHASHNHTHHEQGAEPSDSFWTSKAFLVCAAFLIISVVLLWTEHLAHALGYLPYLLILACPLMHLFMHGGHGGHGHNRQKDHGQHDGGKP